MDLRGKYYARKAQGLCARCGDPAEAGKMRCAMCAKIENVKAREYYHRLTEKQKAEKIARQMRWKADNPERMEVYRLRKADYNRRYRESV